MTFAKKIQSKLPRFLNVTIGVFVALFLILFSPVIALLNPQWQYLWKEIKTQIGLWADGVKTLWVCSLKHNSWFDKA